MQNNVLRSLFFTLNIFLVTVCLTGCQPTVFGVPQDQWNQLTPQQKSQIIDAYNQRKQTNAENAPIMAAIGAASSTLNNSINHRDMNTNTNPPASPSIPDDSDFNPPAMPNIPNIPMHGGCVTQGNTQKCNYSGSVSEQSLGSTTSHQSGFSFN